MNQTRLGCLTPAGLLAAALTAAVVLVITLVQGGVLFQPGALNAQEGDPIGGASSHADLSNTCNACHAPFWDTGGMAARCMTCHTEIVAEQADPLSLHSVLIRSELNGACRTCHPDHRGAEAALTVLDTENFPHEALGFPLEGKHATLACLACHLNDQYHPLPMDCFSCHAGEDAHSGQLGADCALCHTPAGWTPSTFDHNLSVFKLEGEHAAIACEACHINGVFRGTAMDCFSCHVEDDAHEGQYGTGCEMCHSPAAWKPATFDHNLSTFQLDGKHATVKCADCHTNAIFKGTPTDCYTCHVQDDEHNGRFGTACQACHATSGWMPPTFDHRLSAFPLTGAHVVLDCTKCHKDNVFTNTPTACAACHPDPGFHVGMFTGSTCDACHSTVSWSPAGYNGQHPSGCDGNCIDHEDATCRDCHTANLATATCTKCHENGVPQENGGGGDD